MGGRFRSKKVSGTFLTHPESFGIVALMGRPHRAAEGGYVYHVLNRANARMPVFEDEGDYEAFETVLAQAVERTETRLLAYCVMPNHWHLVGRAEEDIHLNFRA